MIGPTASLLVSLLHSFSQPFWPSSGPWVTSPSCLHTLTSCILLLGTLSQTVTPWRSPSSAVLLHQCSLLMLAHPALFLQGLGQDSMLIHSWNVINAHILLLQSECDACKKGTGPVVYPLVSSKTPNLEHSKHTPFSETRDNMTRKWDHYHLKGVILGL